MALRQWTDYQQTFFIPGYYLQGLYVQASFSDRNRNVLLRLTNLEINDVDEEGSYVRVELNQQQTAMFSPYKSVDFQINWIGADNKRRATEIITFPVKENLIKEVL